jgi:glycosyltransferase involved in cell wall biosynthesis
MPIAKRPSLPVPNPFPIAPNITTHSAPVDVKWVYRLWHRLRLPIPVQWFTGKLDLFHAPDFVLPPIQGNIPTLLTVHDLSFIHYPDTFTPALVNFLNNVVPRSVNRATHILADSYATKSDLVDLWQVPKDKITVLYSGVHPRFQPSNDEQKLAAVRQKHELGDTPYLLSLSTIHPRKNYQMLIRAFKPIAEQFPHNLIIGGGKGWLYEPVFAEVEKQGLQGRVKFIGFVDDEDLPALYTQATLFLFPSLYEGFGLPLLEAMACGVPVISSNSSSLPEVAGNSALTLDPLRPHLWTKTITQLLQDPSQRVKMVSAGFRQTQDFTWQRSANQLLQIYQDLLRK